MASYYVWSGAVGAANGTSWANAYTTLAAAISGKATSDIFYIANDHNETTAGTVTISGPALGAIPVRQPRRIGAAGCGRPHDRRADQDDAATTY